jgi:serine/threonine-protein kinase
METESSGRYEILSSLAAGGMAEVFLARVQGAAGFSKLIALKRIHSELADDHTFVERFLDEARLAARLSHPNIIQIFDLGIYEGSYFLAMEYVHGKTVWELCRAAARRGQIPPLDVSLGIVVSACEGLGFAHDQRDPEGKPLGIVHRDVSPQNLLISFDGAVKIADFGIARASGNAHKTEVGAIVGKLSYMSPEQMLGQRVDRRTDVYALGVILHELLTAQKLWTANQLDPEHRHAPRAPSTVNESVPHELDEITLRALSYDVDRRYPSCDVLREDLEQVMVRLGIVNSSRRRAELLQAWFPGDRNPPSDSGPIVTGGTRPEPGTRTTITLERKLARSATGKTPAPFADPPTRPDPLLDEPEDTAPTVLPAEVPPSGPVPARDSGRRPMPDIPQRDSRGLPPMPSQRKRSPNGQLMVVAASIVILVAAGLYPLVRRRSHTAAPVSPAASPPAPPPPAALPPKPIDPPVLAAEPVEPPVVPPPIVPETQLEPHTGRHRQDKQAPAKHERGTLSLTTTPPVQVFQGSHGLGRTPLRDAPLPAGRNRLRLVARESGIDLPLDVEIAAGETVSRTVVIGKAKLRIRALPWAAVTIDGNDLGTTPLAPQSLYAGAHSVVLTYKPEGGTAKVRREQLTLKEGEDRLLEADLR